MANDSCPLSARHRCWRVYLAWPLVLLCAYANALGGLGLMEKAPNERLAPVLLGGAILVSLARWLSERRPWFLVLLVLALSLFCRELHVPGTSMGIYVALLAIAAWSVLWYRYISRDIRASGAFSYLPFALATYLLSQFVAWRGFGGMQALGAGNALFRTGLEESLENVAHLAVLVVTLRGLPTEWHSERDDAPADRPDVGGSLLLPN